MYDLFLYIKFLCYLCSVGNKSLPPQYTMIDIYEKVTNEIIAIIDKTGKLPWSSGWRSEGGFRFATSYATGKKYSFLNQCLLGFEGGEWITFAQCEKLGGKVKKGAKSKFVYFAKRNVKETINENGETETKVYYCYKYSNVFNVNDCEGIKPKNEILPTEIVDFVDDTNADLLISQYVARTGIDFVSKEMIEGFECPHYSPTYDRVVVPKKSQFNSPNAYYSVTFHELVHSTLTADRCDRKSENELSRFGNEQYSKEELVAELGSAMILARLGIEGATKNNAAYIKSWLSALKNDKKMLISAASKAEKAVKFIFNETVEVAEVA